LTASGSLYDKLWLSNDKKGSYHFRIPEARLYHDRVKCEFGIANLSKRDKRC
jgi:hypothetical protein